MNLVLYFKDVKTVNDLSKSDGSNKNKGIGTQDMLGLMLPPLFHAPEILLTGPGGPFPR